MIRFDRVCKSYGQRKAVDELSLTIKRGEIMGLLGPNGAGKSTSVAMLCGLFSCDSGAISIDGTSPQQTATRRKLGLAPQQLALYEQLSAIDNLAFFGALYSLAGDDLPTACQHALALVGLSDRAQDKVSTFSGGMQRRLNLAVALLHDPDIIVLDEPTAGVDPQSRNKLFEVVLELKQLGKTIIYTTHYMEDATRLCDRVAIIDQGRLMACDSVSGLIRQHGGDSTIVIHDGQHQAPLVTKNVVPTLRTVTQQLSDDSLIEVRTPTLESVFLQLTGRHLRD
jgi:ABC-2 type transport system ATP-binding protein